MLKGNHWLARMLLGSALSVGAMAPSVAEELVTDEPTGGDVTTTRARSARCGVPRH